MDRPDLELAVTLADSGSLTATAAALHVTQPALSRRLARLERELGGALFVRGRHGAVPTPAGLVLVERSRDVLDALTRVETDTAEAIAGRAGRVRVGTTPTLGADLLPELLAEVRAARPDIRLDLVTRGDSLWLLDEVRKGRLDVAMAVIGATTPPDLRVTATGRQPFVLVLPTDHPLARHKRVNRAALAGQPIVALAHGEGLRQQLDMLFAELGVEPTIAIETSEREMLIPFVTAGLGLTLLPEVFARQRAGAGVEIRPLDPPLARRVGAVVRRGPVDALVSAFLEVVREHAWPRDRPPTVRRRGRRPG